MRQHRPDSTFNLCCLTVDYSMVLTVESVSEILWCDHSNKRSSAVLSSGIVLQNEFDIFWNFGFSRLW